MIKTWQELLNAGHLWVKDPRAGQSLAVYVRTTEENSNRIVRLAGVKCISHKFVAIAGTLARHFPPVDVVGIGERDVSGQYVLVIEWDGQALLVDAASMGMTDSPLAPHAVCASSVGSSLIYAGGSAYL